MTSAVRSRYALGEPLGTGSVGTVYRTQFEGGGPALAIKVLNPEFADSPAVLERFSKDAAKLRRLRNPHLVAVTDLAVKADRVAIVTELVSGDTLADHLLLQGVLPVPATLALIRQVLTGLVAAHAVGLTHGRLTPTNVLLSSSTVAGSLTAKISDHATFRLISGAAAAGSYCLTPYAAPEVAAGRSPTPASDLFSAGVMLHELLTGTLPANARASVAGPARRTSSAQPLRRPADISPSLWRVLVGWLSPHPAKRPPNAWAALRAIENLPNVGAPSRPARQLSLTKQPANPTRPTLSKVPTPARVYAGALGGPDLLDAAPDLLKVTSDLPVIVSDLSLVAPVEATAGAPTIPPPFVPPFVPAPPFGSLPTREEAEGAQPEPSETRSWLRRWSQTRWFNAVGIGAVLILVAGSIYGLASNSPAKSYSYNFTVETAPQNGVLIRRTWTLTGGDHPALHADLEFRTTQSGATTVDELVPSDLLANSTSVTFNPEPQRIDANHVVRYRLPAGSNQVVDAGYTIALASKDVSEAALQRWAVQQQQETSALYLASHQLASISLAKSVTVAVGKSIQLAVSAKQTDGLQAPSVALGGARYKVDNTKIATVASDGRLTGKKAGKTTVHVTIGKLSVASSVVVTAAKSSKAKVTPRTNAAVPTPTIPAAVTSTSGNDGPSGITTGSNNPQTVTNNNAGDGPGTGIQVPPPTTHTTTPVPPPANNPTPPAGGGNGPSTEPTGPSTPPDTSTPSGGDTSDGPGGGGTPPPVELPPIIATG